MEKLIEQIRLKADACGGATKEQREALHKPYVSGSFSKCPECLQPKNQDELDMFGGVCEECSGVFDE